MSPVAAEVASAERAPAPDVDPPPVDVPLALEVLPPMDDGAVELELADEPQPDAAVATAAHAISVDTRRFMVRILQRAPELVLNACLSGAQVGRDT